LPFYPLVIIFFMVCCRFFKRAGLIFIFTTLDEKKIPVKRLLLRFTAGPLKRRIFSS